MSVDRNSGRKGKTQRMARPGRAGLALLAALALAGCVSASRGHESFVPVMGWDGRKGTSEWTEVAFLAVSEHDDVLAGQVPADIGTWCPGYASATLDERRAFWVGMMSAVSHKESGWNPAAVGGGGRYIGLMQISPATARNAGCEARSAASLKNGAENLACAVEIFADKVAQDGMVAGGGNRGMGRDWGPFRKAQLRRDMAAWVSKQPYCQG